MTKRKNKLLFGVSMVGIVTALSYLQMAPLPIANAQTIDPGQEPDPAPKVEATVTPKPCPGATTVVATTQNAKWEWSCDKGGPIKTTILGAFVKTTKDNCNGDKTENLTSSWVVKDKRVKLVETIPPSYEGGESFDVYEAEYDLVEIRSDGEEIQIAINQKPFACCGP